MTIAERRQGLQRHWQDEDEEQVEADFVYLRPHPGQKETQYVQRLWRDRPLERRCRVQET